MSALSADAGLEAALWQIFRNYYDTAEETRRWSLTDDIPWKEARLVDHAHFLEMIESLLAVKLKVVDISSKVIPRVRVSFGRTWFYATWGYEELRHNLALSDWLLASKHHTQEKLGAFEDAAIPQEWELPCPDLPGLLAHALVQEAAMVEWVGKLARMAREIPADPALLKVLDYLLADDRAHFEFFAESMRLQLKFEPEGVRDKLQAALLSFTFPALPTMPDGRRRLDTLAKHGIGNQQRLSSVIDHAITARS